MKKVFTNGILNKFYFLFFGILISFNCLAANPVRIYEIYGGGGNGSATYNEDFIVLYNDAFAPVVMDGWSLQYAPSGSVNGTAWDQLNITSLTIPAKGFILISIATTGTVGIGFPLPADLFWNLGSGGIAQGAGKIALMPNQTNITTSVPPAGAIDFVGYGTTANASEGSAAPTPSATQGIVRKNDGLDSDNNATDFVLTGSAAPSVLRPSNSSSFPVKLTQLSAKVLEEKQAIINWQTSSETGFSHFEIQRSGDAKGFETIGRENGKTELTEKNNYFFVDKSPLVGLNYYRLNQVDLDGKSEFSKIISVNFNEAPGIVFFPNPVEQYLEIKGFEENTIEKVNVFNSSGLFLGTIKPTNKQLDLSGFTGQTFLIETILNDGSSTKKRINRK
jgi:Lamin Tail Domain